MITELLTTGRIVQILTVCSESWISGIMARSLLLYLIGRLISCIVAPAALSHRVQLSLVKMGLRSLLLHLSIVASIRRMALLDRDRCRLRRSLWAATFVIFFSIELLLVHEGLLQLHLVVLPVHRAIVTVDIRDATKFGSGPIA